MDSREGQIYDLQAGYYTSEVGVDGSDFDSLGMFERMTWKGLPQSSGPFWVSEDDEMESAPRDMKHRWKKMMQKRIIGMGSEDAGDEKQGDMAESKWKDMPMELLVRILALGDDRTVVVATGVCTGWRDSICAGVTDLSFAWCKKSVSNLVQSVAHKFSRLENCSIRRCSYLTDDAMRAAVTHWHELRSLDLTNGTRLTNVSLIALSNGCALLEKLDLSGCVGVSEAGLVGLAQHCKHLRHLNLCGCDNAGSDAALVALAQNCSGLQYLNVGWCEKITDVGVTALARGCRDLRFVDFCGCLQITDQSVIILADNCLRLRVLGFHCCRNITDLAIYSLVNSSKRRDALRSNKRSSSTGSNSRVRDRNEYPTTSRSSFGYSSAGSCSSSSGSSCNSNAISTSKGGGFDTSYLRDPAGYGLVSLNLSGCTALSAQAVQALCDTFPQLHTCPERRSVITSGCLNLTSVRCICVIEARRERLSRASRTASQPSQPRHLTL